MKNFAHFPLQVLMFFVLFCFLFVTETKGQWQSGRATCYQNAGGGACGYNTGAEGYGDQITAVSAPLFGDKGAFCGACYEVQCVNSPNCYTGVGAIKVTVTDFCPSSSGPSAWCNPPQKHFDMSIPMFTKLAPYKVGIVPVSFRRVPCWKNGGVRFYISPQSSPNWLQVVVHNVGGDGVVTNVQIKGSRTGWMQMIRGWGQNWDISQMLIGQDLSFQVTCNGRTLVFNNVVPASWRNDQTFNGAQNF